MAAAQGVVIGPLSALIQQVLSIAQRKDRSQRLAVENGDEIGVLAKQFDHMLDQLLETEGLAMLGQITATVSHELRNPLGPMRNSVFAIAEGTRGKGLNVEKALERIDRNNQRCDGIIGDLRAFAQRREPNMTASAIDAWLDKVLDERELPQGITITRAFAAPGGEALIDSEQRECVIDEVVENACHAIADAEASGEGEFAKDIRIDSRSAGNRLEIAVIHQGLGIPPDVLPKICEPLFSTKGFEVGVGLPTAKRIVEPHGGTLTLDSAMGKGTTVSLRFPAERGFHNTNAA